MITLDLEIIPVVRTVIILEIALKNGFRFRKSSPENVVCSSANQV